MRDAKGGELPVGVISERRRAERVRVEVGCQAVTEEDFALLGDTIVDLSGSGCLLRAEGICADVGERLIVSFKPPHSAVWIDAEATIVRLLNGKDPCAPAFALSLEGLNGFEQEVLKGAITRVRRPGPQARRRRQRIDKLRSRRGYVDPDAVTAQPLVSVRDHVTTLPRTTPKPRAKPTRERPLPAAILGRVNLQKKAVKASDEPRLPRSLWRDEPAPARTDSVVVMHRGYKRPLPRTRLQSLERQSPAATSVDAPPADTADSRTPEGHTLANPASEETMANATATGAACTSATATVQEPNASVAEVDAPSMSHEPSLTVPLPTASVAVCRPRATVVVADRPAAAVAAIDEEAERSDAVHQERVVVVR